MNLISGRPERKQDWEKPELRLIELIDAEANIDPGPEILIMIS